MVIAIAAIIGIIGLGLVALGVRGRVVSDHPFCSGCRFDLVGLHPGAGVCPECGADLARDDAVYTGRRQCRSRMLTAGVLLLVISLGPSSAIVWAAASGIDPNTMKPVWLLLWEGANGSTATRDASLAELHRRAQGDLLDRPTLDRIVDRALEVQADPSRPWHAGWSDIVEHAWDTGKLADRDIERYMRRAAELALVARPRVRQGDPVPANLRVEGRAGEVQLGVIGYVHGVKIDGSPVSSGSIGAFKSTPLRSGMLRFGVWDLDVNSVGAAASALVHVPGEHRVTARIDLFVFRADDWDRKAKEWPLDSLPSPYDLASGDCWQPGWLDGTPSTGSLEREAQYQPAGVGPLVSCRRELSATFTVVGADQQTIELIEDAAAAAALAEWLPSEEHELRCSQHEWGGGAFVRGSWGEGPGAVRPYLPEISLAFDVAWRAGDREWDPGTLVVAGQGVGDGHCFQLRSLGWGYGEYGGWVTDFDDFDAETVDVILRPSVNAAAATVNIDRILDAEFTIPDVPVRHSGR
jgi:hypothetical protein